MSKFLNLLEQYGSEGNDKWDLIEFLQSKGIKVSNVRDTNMVYIDDGVKTYAIEVLENSAPEEEAETVIRSGPSEYGVDDEVEKLASKANKRTSLKGAAGALVGTSAQRAKTAVNRRSKLGQKAVGAYDKKTREIEKSLREMS